MNQKDTSCLGVALLSAVLLAGLVLLCATVFPGNITGNIIRIEHRPIIRIEPTPAPTATPNVYFEALLARARAAATAEVIQAEADARSQGTDDEIRLAWNKHFMRRWWFVASIPAGVVFTGLGAYLYFWKVRG